VPLSRGDWHRQLQQNIMARIDATLPAWMADRAMIALMRVPRIFLQLEGGTNAFSRG